MGLAEATTDVVNILSGAHGANAWERIVLAIEEDAGLPDDETKLIERAVATAYAGWSDGQRRSIWYETDSGMTDDDDDDALCDTSFNGIGYSLQIEVVDAVVNAAQQAATDRRAGDPNGRKLGKPKG
jgi:hypothetical protein